MEMQVLPPSVRRLYALKEGERVVFYRGNLKEDISRSDGAYAELLQRISYAAESLCNDSKIAIRLRAVERKRSSLHGIVKTWTELEYEAVGL